ncbi:MAG TPA: ABC transporter substrate-binding protein [Candidatus Aminicenantes bacterium]|nr:ABC transporter substrate-binding protein [Candidatus Aminicenantes bacterium]HRY64653.1 ABC transporter substrate-binding protein [Candidatus Aminicenantes bacterium]HRZ71566.1 ABC transporter substrate-binding protein [Candidatus Aminicenantes bacterium]
MIIAGRARVLPAGLSFLLAASLLSAGPVRPRSQDVKELPRYGGTFRIKGFSAPFNQIFDPAGPAHHFITEQLFDGLVKFDGRFHPMPALAEYWTITDGGTRIVFHLRRGVRFHNGRELAADDVKFSLERLVKDRPDNSLARLFAGKVVGAEEYRAGQAAEVDGFRVLDPATFEIRWLRPYVAGLYLLGMYACKILPRDLVEGQGRSFFYRPVGTGPFKFAEWLRGPQLEILGVRLERNQDYHDGPPFLAALEYSPHFTDEQFLSGDIHLVSVTSERLLRGGFRVLENGTLKSYFLAFSCDIPPLDRPEVRRALALGLDKARLAAASDQPGTLHQVLDNFIPPYLPGFFPRAAEPFTDVDAARLLLDRLLPVGGRKALKLTLLYDGPKTDETSGFARELGRQLEALGIGLDVRSLRRPEDARAVRQPYLRFLAYDMDFPDPENILLPLFYSGSPANAMSSRYDDPRLDDLLERSAAETSWERRTDLFRTMEKILLEEAPAVPLFTERIRIAVQPQVRGIELPAMGFIFLDARRIWLGTEGRR